MGQAGRRAGDGEYPIRANTAYAIELSVVEEVPEWGGQEVRIMLEEDAVLRMVAWSTSTVRRNCVWFGSVRPVPGLRDESLWLDTLPHQRVEVDLVGLHAEAFEHVHDLPRWRFVDDKA